MSKENTEDNVVDDVLKELQEEGHTIEGQEPAVEVQEQPPVDEPVVEETTEETTEEVQEPEVQETDKEPVNRVPKEPTLIPAWKAKIAEDKLSKENAELKKQIEEFQKNPTEENKQVVEDGVADIRQLATEHGLEIDDKQEQFFKALVQGVQKNAMPDDVLKNVEAFQKHQEITHLENQYAQEFSGIVPLIKEKFGEVSDEQLTNLQNKLHDVAFTEQYAKVPLSKIFKAEADDLGFKPSKQPIVANKSGKTRGVELDLSDVDESTFANLSGEEIDKFVERKAGKRQWSR